jgi:hypothetical protein
VHFENGWRIWLPLTVRGDESRGALPACHIAEFGLVWNFTIVGYCFPSIAYYP